MIGNPVQEVKISAATPCWNSQESSTAPNQPFYVGELSRSQDKCRNPNQNYQQVSSEKGWSISEYSLQEENSVLSVLRESRSYTYSFFPDDESKKNVDMKVWQLPIANWKLECTADNGKDIKTAMDSFTSSTEPWQ